MIRRHKKAGEPKGPPAWVVSFCDMVTLLLAFFILLQVFSVNRDPELFNAGRGAFRRAIAGLGIPDLLFGRGNRPEFGFRQSKFAVEEDPENLENSRIIDVEDEVIRSLFDQLRRQIATETSDQKGPPVRFVTTPIRFAPSDAALGSPARDFLRGFLRELQADPKGSKIEICVIGLAPDAPTPKGQWLLSVERASMVGRFLESNLPDEFRGRVTRIRCWGTGPGHRWSDPASSGSSRSCIAIAVMESGGVEWTSSDG